MGTFKLKVIQQSQKIIISQNMFYINSPLTVSSFNLTNLIGIFAPILGQFNIILTNLALYTDIFDISSLFFNFFLYFNYIFAVFTFVLFCGIITTGASYFILHSSRIADKIIKNAGNIGTGVVGLVTGLDAAFNLGDRLKKGGGSGDSEPEKNKDTDNKDSDKKEENKDNNESKEDKKS
jgi:hypothetical protein